MPLYVRLRHNVKCLMQHWERVCEGVSVCVCVCVGEHLWKIDGPCMNDATCFLLDFIDKWQAGVRFVLVENLCVGACEWVCVTTVDWEMNLITASVADCTHSSFFAVASALWFRRICFVHSGFVDTAGGTSFSLPAMRVSICLHI